MCPEKKANNRSKSVPTEWIFSDHCFVLSETKTQIFFQNRKLTPEMVIIDSVQTLHTDYIDSSPGVCLRLKKVP